MGKVTIESATEAAGRTVGENWFTHINSYAKLFDEINSDASFVEVGSWKGRSSVFMAHLIKNGDKAIKFYCVDTWKGSPEHVGYECLDTLYDLFLENTKDYRDVIMDIRKPSTEAAEDFSDKSIDIVFIDACHEYECVKEDILAWLPKIKNGGIMAGHDYAWRADIPVKRAVDEIFGNQITLMDGDVWRVDILS